MRTKTVLSLVTVAFATSALATFLLWSSQAEAQTSYPCTLASDEYSCHDNGFVRVAGLSFQEPTGNRIRTSSSRFVRFPDQTRRVLRIARSTAVRPAGAPLGLHELRTTHQVTMSHDGGQATWGHWSSSCYARSSMDVRPISRWRIETYRDSVNRKRYRVVRRSNAELMPMSGNNLYLQMKVCADGRNEGNETIGMRVRVPWATYADNGNHYVHVQYVTLQAQLRNDGDAQDMVAAEIAEEAGTYLSDIARKRSGSAPLGGNNWVAVETVDGESTGSIGFDYRTPEHLVGLSLSHIGTKGNVDALAYTSRLNVIQPYAALYRGNSTLWATAGAGAGNLDTKHGIERFDHGSQLMFAAFGAEHAPVPWLRVGTESLVSNLQFDEGDAIAGDGRMLGGEATYKRIRSYATASYAGPLVNAEMELGGLLDHNTAGWSNVSDLSVGGSLPIGQGAVAVHSSGLLHSSDDRDSDWTTSANISWGGWFFSADGFDSEDMAAGYTWQLPDSGSVRVSLGEDAIGLLAEW